jgi:hypothetical protein
MVHNQTACSHVGPEGTCGGRFDPGQVNSLAGLSQIERKLSEQAPPMYQPILRLLVGVVVNRLSLARCR